MRHALVLVGLCCSYLFRQQPKVLPVLGPLPNGPVLALLPDRPDDQPLIWTIGKLALAINTIEST